MELETFPNITFEFANYKRQNSATTSENRAYILIHPSTTNSTEGDYGNVIAATDIPM